MATAWVLNLDADLELAAGPRYAPTRTVLEAMRPHAAWLAERLMAPGDVWLQDGVRAPGMIGRAFCPTPRAIAEMVRAGVVPAPHPPVEVLRRVNSRAFCHALGPTLPGASFVQTLDEAQAILADEPPEGDGWRIKRAFGMAGRGQRVARGDLSFLRAWVIDGVMIEPNVSIVTEWGRHGMLAEDGTLTLGHLVRQRCDPHGQWLATELADDAEIDGALEREARSVAAALHEAGYFGPFGVDAFTYRARDGAIRLQPRSEINARYSMGWPIGISGRRRDG